MLRLSVIKVDGMTCEHCSTAVRRAVESTKEAHLCRVALDKHECYVVAGRKASMDRIADAIEAAGYLATPAKCNREVSVRIPEWVSCSRSV